MTSQNWFGFMVLNKCKKNQSKNLAWTINSLLVLSQKPLLVLWKKNSKITHERLYKIKGFFQKHGLYICSFILKFFPNPELPNTSFLLWCQKEPHAQRGKAAYLWSIFKYSTRGELGLPAKALCPTSQKSHFCTTLWWKSPQSSPAC